MTATRWAVLVGIVVLIGAFFLLDLDRHLTLESLQQSRAQIVTYRDAHPVLASAAFLGIYIVVTGVSLPGAAILTLAGGAIFGLLWGLVLVSFGSSIGATLAFLASRFLLRDFVQRRFGTRLEAVNRGVQRDGAFYVITLRLIPLFPFFVINLVMALTPLRVTTFYWASQLGMLPLTVIFVNAGTELAKIDRLQDIVSPGLLGSLVLIGLFPLIARKVVEKINARRHQA